MVLAPQGKRLNPDGAATPIPMPWVVAIISARTGLRALDGLDPDPFIAGTGVAEIILHSSGIADEFPPHKFQRASAALRDALATAQSKNEAAIHSVIEKHPWILVDAWEFSEFRSKPTITYTESLDPSSPPEVQTIVPDFLYDCYDQTTLVVEIEASSKKLLKKTEETGYQLPRAPLVDALFQIGNYKRIMSGKFGSQVCRQLNKPDSWSFSYLLVIGSKLQENFDERSWANTRDAMVDIQVRTWDYYLDRLQRLQEASTCRG